MSFRRLLSATLGLGMALMSCGPVDECDLGKYDGLMRPTYVKCGERIYGDNGMYFDQDVIYCPQSNLTACQDFYTGEGCETPEETCEDLCQQIGTQIMEEDGLSGFFDRVEDECE